VYSFPSPPKIHIVDEGPVEHSISGAHAAYYCYVVDSRSPFRREGMHVHAEEKPSYDLGSNIILAAKVQRLQYLQS
jgi:hypothetical protein